MKYRTTLISANRPALNCGLQMMEHTHLCYQLYYVHQGNPVFFIEETELHAGPGSVFYISPDTPHRTLPLPEGGMCVSELKVQINDDYIKSHLKKTPNLMHDSGSIRKMLDYVMRNWRCREEKNLENIDSILSSIFLGFFVEEIHFARDDSYRIITTNYNKTTRKVMAYIEENYQNQFSLETLGKDLNYNKCYLSATFSKCAGISIVDYLNFIRIRKAVGYFAFYAQDVFSVAENVGYLNTSYFSRTFKSMTGASPRDFKYVFSTIDRTKLQHLFTDEPILCFKLCTLTEAFQSLRSLGSIVNKYCNKPET